MADIPGSVKVSGFVAPTSDTDIYPAHSEEWGRGGYRSVPDLTARNAITAERRSEGMLVNVLATNTVYKLVGGITNADWTPFSIAGGSSYLEITDPVDGQILVYDDVLGKFVNETASAGGTVTYSTTSPVPTTIGGIEAGKEYTNENITTVINDLLFPYQYPAFSTFTVAGASSGSYEVGYTYAAGDKVFAWTTTNNSNIKPNSVTLNGTAGLANDGTETQAISAITNNTVATSTFTISAENTKNQTFSKIITLSWSMKRFWGVSASTSLDDAGILLLNSEIATSRVKTVTYDCTGGRYFYFAYPSAWGDLNNTKINSLTWNDWVLVSRGFVNQYGVTIPMNIYRSYNLLNGTITVVWG